MLVVGLTGSIGMGKSAIALRLREHGVPVFDADAEVHRLYRGAAAPLVEAAFLGTTANGQVDRVKLAAALAAQPGGFERLEAIVHPLVHQAERAFLHAAAAKGAALAVLEIPLLFEGGSDKKMDAVIVASAALAIQQKRVMERPGMTLEKLKRLVARQMPDEEKRKRADFVVDTNGSLADTHHQTDAIIARLAAQSARAFARDWA